jgi:hypothetical protein
MSIGSSVADMAGATSTMFGLVADERMAEADAAREELAALGDAATDADREAAQKTIQEAERLAQQAFNAGRAAAIAEATINGAVAITMALAQLGPVAGAFAAAGITATVAAQIAIIAKQEMHRGGMVGDPSERIATLRQGEGVLTQQGVAAIGGPSGLAQANMGRGGSGAIRLEFRVGNQVAQELVYAGTRGPGRGRTATQALRPTGRINPYRRAS